jgi:hypothetical protein
MGCDRLLAAWSSQHNPESKWLEGGRVVGARSSAHEDEQLWCFTGGGSPQRIHD